MTKETQLSFEWQPVPSRPDDQPQLGLPPLYPPSIETALNVLVRNANSRTLKLSSRSKREISGTLNFLEKGTTFTPADFLPADCQRLFQLYLNYPRPPLSQPVSWLKLQAAAQEAGLPGAPAARRKVLQGLIRITRAAAQEDPIERLVLPWYLYDRLWEQGIKKARQLLKPSPPDIEKIWGACLSRPIYQKLQAHLQQFDPDWNPPPLKNPIFSHELSPEDLRSLAGLRPATPEDQVTSSIARQLLSLRLPPEDAV